MAAAVPRLGGLSRALPGCPGLRAGPRRNPVARARPAERRARARADASASLPLRPAPDGGADHRAPAHERDAQRLQELRGLLHRRAARIDGAGKATRRLHGARLRIVLRRHRAVPRLERHRARGDALGRVAHPRSRLPRSGTLVYQFDWSSIPGALPFLWQGMKISLEITFLAIAVGIVWGTILAVMRLSPVRPLAFLASAYVSLFRSVPLVMVLLWFFLVVPTLLRDVLGLSHATDLRLASAMVGFSLFEAAYYSEIMRAGIQSVSRGQVQAALALGMRPLQAMWLVVLPQAFRNMTPLLLTQAIILFQDTSLVYVSALADFFGAAYKVGDRDGRLVEMLLFAGAVYFVICSAASYAVRRFQRGVAA